MSALPPKADIGCCQGICSDEIRFKLYLTAIISDSDDGEYRRAMRFDALLKSTPLDALLKSERRIVLIGLLCLVVLAAIYTVFGVGMKMSAIQMTGVGAVMMAHAPWTVAYAVLVFLMWWIMMVTMMVPSAAPMILLFSALKRGRTGLRHPVALTFTFLSGYLLIWALFSLAMTGLQWSLEIVRLLTPNMQISETVLGGVILIGAGSYQFSAWKNACLKQCQSPVRFMVERRRPGFAGALRMGLEHGAFCLGCCWFLMLLLFVGGVMNLYWIGGLAIYVLLEKLIPDGFWLGRTSGALLCVVGALWVIFPGGL